MPSRLLLFFLALGVLAVAAGCLISTDDYSKTCTTAAQCPMLDGYRCVSANAWPQQDCGKNETGCVCQVQFPPGVLTQYDGGNPDSGPPVDAGPTPDYCTEIKPILTLSCIGTCHGVQMGYPGSPPNFRLDYYVTPDAGGPDGGPGLPGVYEMRLRVQARINDTTSPMPPTDFPLPPTQAQRDLVSKWVDRGAPYGSGNCETKPDGGADGGVSFSIDVEPIFGLYCSPCHTTDTPRSGNLDLSSSAAYNALVGPDATCMIMGATVKRVVPFDTTNSLLWRKLTPDGGACGNTMPNMGTVLRTAHTAEFNTIDAWIRQGAKNN